MQELESEVESPVTGTKSVPGFLDRPAVRNAAGCIIGILVACVVSFGFFYLRFARVIDRRLAAGEFSGTLSVYSEPKTVRVGDTLAPEAVVARLRQSGYTTSPGSPQGRYEAKPGVVEIFPGPDSYSGGQPAILEFSGGKLAHIRYPDDHSDHQSFDLEPRLVTGISLNREQRDLVRFSDIPQTLVQAVVSAEDKHFFHHSGIDFFRILKAGWLDMKSGRKEQGASTLTMQLARAFWLEPEKRWKRKVEEFFITLHLEEKLTKQQIFEDYANEVYLGRHGTFSISGFGVAAHAYFSKSLSQLTIPEAALLAGMVQRPSYFNPVRYPERARERRDTVLAMMRRNGYLNDTQYQQAVATPVRVASDSSENPATQYFVDMMNDELQNRLDAREQQARYVYTTIDPDLQEAAQAAVEAGMKTVDRLVHVKGAQIPPDQPQVALIALDPRTGAIRALVGGRSYNVSQLNHALAMRQPGSVFKPFVYAAALDTGIAGGGSQVYTPATVLNDVPTTFLFNHVSYQPGNFDHDFSGDVTLRTALARSLNVPAVEVAQAIGYNRVVALARRAGLNKAIQATPAVALGAYETTPLEIAGAYTMFANQGIRMTPSTIAEVRAADGTLLYQHQTDPYPVLDPRVNYLMVNLMQEVLRSGTGAAVRSMGFTQPAAGKTGTSRDGWFAGFTSELLCVVWVGFDDNRELNLEGARSALPVWTEFMNRAAKLREYHDAKPFQAPPGIVSESICEDSGKRAGDDCPNTHWEVFISGTQPLSQCDLHGGGAGGTTASIGGPR
ncbi:MAG TPA: PBP1A family penicillin-binding protein [Bryobacteraceae bacterium]|nr:PBP1A family penicillin-binding protein [Bryobacteraceae bacterium]